MIATVLFTDIVGSTERASQLGDRRWRELLRAHHDAVRGQLRHHHGQEIATAGDGFLAVFDSPANALLCADAIRRAVREQGLSVRCGVHIGEVEREGANVGGIAVHIGARVAALADADEILVSGTVRDAETGSDFGFEDRGRHELKGVAGEWRIHALTHVPADLVPSPSAAPRSGVAERIGRAGLAKVLGVYVFAAAIVFILGSVLHNSLGLPDWVPAVMVVLLVAGLVVVGSTAVAQSRSRVGYRDAARSVARGELPHLTWGRAIAGGAFAFAMLFGVAGLWVVIQDRGRSFAPEEALADAAPGVAVLPFSVQGEGLGVWREGAVDLIGSNIDGAAGLRAIDGRTLLARWHDAVGDGEDPDLATSLEVARKTGARYALLGTAVALGRDLRLTADVYDVESGSNLGQAQVEGSPDSVYMLVDRLSIEALRTILDRPVDDLPRIDLARVTTTSLPALRAYLEGEVLYRKADWPGALEAYGRAVAADSTFALAWLRVGNAISWMPDDARPQMGLTSAYERAGRFADRLPEREAIAVRASQAFDQGSMAMLEPLRSATRRYPDDPELAYILGEHYAHFDDQLLADWAETARILARAIELDPTFAPYYQHPIEYAFWLGDSARALQLLAEFEKLAPETREARRYRLAATLAWGTPSERAGAMAALEMSDDWDMAPVLLFYHPRFLDIRLATADIQYRKGNAFRYVTTNLVAGRLSKVDDALAAGRGLEQAGFDTTVLVFLRQRGVPVDPERLHRAATRDTLFPNVFYAAMLAAEEGRTAELQHELARGRQIQQSLLASGDTLFAGQVEGEIRMIEGYAALQRGERERALVLLQEGQRKGTGWDEAVFVNAIARWTIAELLVQLGRPEEAIPYFRSFHRSFPTDPWAALELGKIYEALGRREEARERYETALEYWREADPELGPRIAEARQRLSGLGFQPRG